MSRTKLMLGLSLLVALGGCAKVPQMALPAANTSIGPAAFSSVSGVDPNADLTDDQLISLAYADQQSGAFVLPDTSGQMQASGIFHTGKVVFRTVGLVMEGPMGWFVLAREVYETCKANRAQSASVDDTSMKQFTLSAADAAKLAPLKGKLVLLKGSVQGNSLSLKSFSEAKPRMQASFHIPCTPRKTN
jgi:hypothetical protein